MTEKMGQSLRIETIPIDQIRILNPRVRNQRRFLEMVASISKVGLKRPITVSARQSDADRFAFDLVCGQGRMEAFLELNQTLIPAIIIDAEETDCLIRSVVENCARRQHKAMDLLEDIGTLRMRGYNDKQIAGKIGVSVEYVHMIGSLIENGEEKLLSAVEAGTLPLTMAIEIAKSTDEQTQIALTQAYTEKKLRGKKLVAVRRLIERRQRTGKNVQVNRFGRRDPAKKPLTSEGMIRAYRQEADRQRILIKRAEVTQNRLLFVVEAIRTLRDDERFADLLEAEKLATMPAFLEDQLNEGVMA